MQVSLWMNEYRIILGQSSVVIIVTLLDFFAQEEHVDEKHM